MFLVTNLLARHPRHDRERFSNAKATPATINQNAYSV